MELSVNFWSNGQFKTFEICCVESGLNWFSCMDVKRECTSWVKTSPHWL